MLVVLDSCIWCSQVALNSGAGAAVRFYLRQQNAKLVVPEVVRLEVEKLLCQKITSAIETMTNEHRGLLSIFGELKELVLPKEREIEGKIASIFEDVGVEILDVPFSKESAYASFLKTVSGEPPSGPKNQQFKDGVLWADCVALLEQDDVILVTGDLAFFRDRNPEAGVAPNLQAELQGQPHHLEVLPTLAKLLEKIRTDVEVSDDHLVAAFRETHRRFIDDLVDQNGFRLGENLTIKKLLFATERPNVLYVQFDLSCDCDELNGKGRLPAHFEASGDALWDISIGTFSEMHVARPRVVFSNPGGGTSETAGINIGLGSLTIGHRTIKHSVRHRLE